MRKIFGALTILVFVSILADGNNWYIETNPINNNPEAVWSARGMNDSSTEVRYSYLNGTEWAPMTAITSDSIDDHDPRLAFDSSGGRKVVWWSDDTYDRIKYSTLPYTGGSWSTPVAVSDASENCRFPSVVVHDGTVNICFERINASGCREIIATIPESPSPFPEDLVSSTLRTNNLFSKIHSSDGHLWVDWIDSDSSMGYSEKVNGSWTSKQLESYSGQNDLENARIRLKQKVVEN